MVRNLDEVKDDKTGEYNCTLLGEMAINEFDIENPVDQESLWFMAIDVDTDRQIEETKMETSETYWDADDLADIIGGDLSDGAYDALRHELGGEW